MCAESSLEGEMCAEWIFMAELTLSLLPRNSSRSGNSFESKMFIDFKRDGGICPNVCANGLEKMHDVCVVRRSERVDEKNVFWLLYAARLYIFGPFIMMAAGEINGVRDSLLHPQFRFGTRCLERDE